MVGVDTKSSTSNIYANAAYFAKVGGWIRSRLYPILVVTTEGTAQLLLVSYVCMYVCMYVCIFIKCMYVCMYSSMIITYSKTRINRVRLPILLVWSAEQRKEMFPCPRSRLRNWSRETGSAVPSRVSLLILHTQAEYGAYLRNSSRFPRWRQFVYLNRLTPSGQSRVYRVTQLRTDGVRCRKSASTGPVNVKVVPVRGAALAGDHGPNDMRLSFPYPLLV